MRTEIMALLLTPAFWTSVATYQLVISAVASTTAIAIVVQAFQTRKYVWAAAFLASALLFNPAVPLFRLSGTLSLLLIMVPIAPFALSLAALKPQPLLSSIPSRIGIPAVRRYRP